ncbi:MAG: hypothetical protein LKJ80_08130 [Oscillibacter sp.]|jgi:hypothetical protein|nr:hypothetical protein [Oscillibacter sp.]
MASDGKKSLYDDALEEAKRLTQDAADTGDTDGAAFSLEEILAEYGGSREQKLLADVDRTAAPEETAPSAAPAPALEPEAPEPPKSSAVREFRQSPPPEQDPKEPAPEENPPEEPEYPPQPRPISMEEVVGRTVDAVMEETEELLPEKKHRRGLFSRRRLVETEELYQRPPRPPEDDHVPESEPEEPEEPEPIGPEPPLGEAANDSRFEMKHLSRPLGMAVFLTLAAAAAQLVEQRGISVPFWTGEPVTRTGVLLGLLLTVSILCRSVFARGFGMLARRRCTGELLCSLGALATAADCVSSLFLTGRSAAAPYAAAACAALTFAQWGGVRAARARYDTYRTAALSEQPPYLVTDTAQGACKQPGRGEGFYTDSVKPDLPLQWQTALLPLILVGTVVFAGLASLGQGRKEDFLLCWSTILTASASFALPLCWALPWSGLARHLQKSGCAVAGWAGAEAIGRNRSMILTDTDLFPPGTVHFNGIKVFGETLPHAASYAASVIRASGCGLERIFDGLVRSEGGHYYEVDDFSFYEEGGYSGSICGESILLGTASFMRKMEVRLPGNLNLRTGVFLAVDRQLTAVFAVKYSASENVDWALRMLRRSWIVPVLASRDANITPQLLKRKFSRRVRVTQPDLAARVALSEQESGRGRPRALLLREGLAPYAETVAGSRRLTGAVRRCTAVSLLGSAAGALLAFYFSFTGNFSMMPPVTMLVFLLLWTLPVALLSSWTARL